MVEKSKRHRQAVTSWSRDGGHLMMKVIGQNKNKKEKKMNGEFFNHSKFANYQLDDDDVDFLRSQLMSFDVSDVEKGNKIFNDLFSWFFDPDNTTPRHASGTFASTFTSLLDSELNITETAKNTKFDVKSTCQAIRNCFRQIYRCLTNIEKQVDKNDFDVDKMLDAAYDFDGVANSYSLEVAKENLEMVKDDAKKKQKAVGVARSLGLLGATPTRKIINKNLANLMNRDDVISLLESLGSLVADVGKSSGTSHQGNLDVVGVTTGSDFTRLLPSEVARFDGGVLEDDLLRRVTSGDALNWQMANEDESGDFVLLLDMSASMSGSREDQAKAFALFAASRMIQQKRKLVVTMFAGYNRDFDVVEVTSENDLPKLFDLLSNCASGGTYIDKALNKSLSIAKNKNNADLVVISDGELEAATDTVEAVKGFSKNFIWFQIGKLSTNKKQANKLIGLSRYFEVDGSQKSVKKGMANLVKSSLRV